VQAIFENPEPRLKPESVLYGGHKGIEVFGSRLFGREEKPGSNYSRTEDTEGSKKFSAATPIHGFSAPWPPTRNRRTITDISQSKDPTAEAPYVPLPFVPKPSVRLPPPGDILAHLSDCTELSKIACSTECWPGWINSIRLKTLPEISYVRIQSKRQAITRAFSRK
jgi:hypothetical protein